MPHQILLVDDEIEARDETASYLSNKGYGCLTASDVQHALDVILHSPEVAIVITDIKMPGIDGLDFIRTVRSEIDRDIEFIVVTGYIDSEEEVESLRLGGPN